MTRAVVMEFLALISVCAGITIWAALTGHQWTAAIAGGITIWAICVQRVYGTTTHRPILWR